MKRVLCNAVIDPMSDGEFAVTVTGVGHHDGVTRVYHIEKDNEDDAAKEGIRLFVEEIGAEP
jgi:hypothetical protein